LRECCLRLAAPRPAIPFQVPRHRRQNGDWDGHHHRARRDFAAASHFDGVLPCQLDLLGGKADQRPDLGLVFCFALETNRHQMRKHLGGRGRLQRDGCPGPGRNKLRQHPQRLIACFTIRLNRVVDRMIYLPPNLLKQRPDLQRSSLFWRLKRQTLSSRSFAARAVRESPVESQRSDSPFERELCRGLAESDPPASTAVVW
jgi:hypothetical protein